MNRKAGAAIKFTVTFITILRIIGALFLLSAEPLSVLFFLVYLFCGVSDVLDGFLARKFNVTSELGATLDSAADFVLVSVMLILFIPILEWETWIMSWIGVIALIRLVSLGVGFIKYRTIAILHTYANKATGLILFLFPILYRSLNLTAVSCVICSIASLSALEELIITLKSKNINKNVTSILCRPKR